MNIDWDEINNAKVSETIIVSEPSPQQDDYFKTKRLSNSDFDLIPALLAGKEPRPKSSNEIFAFGSALHCAILEPDRFNIEHYPNINQLQLKRLIESCNESKKLQGYLKHSVKEVTHHFEMNELPCKAKIDMLYIGIEGIIDLKTTSATTQEDFEATISKYNYDRQMAFYMDSVGGKRAILIGISKVNFELFFVELKDTQINKGCEKYMKALSQIKENDLFDKIMQYKAS